MDVFAFSPFFVYLLKNSVDLYCCFFFLEEILSCYFQRARLLATYFCGCAQMRKRKANWIWPRRRPPLLLCAKGRTNSRSFTSDYSENAISHKDRLEQSKTAVKESLFLSVGSNSCHSENNAETTLIFSIQLIRLSCWCNRNDQRWQNMLFFPLYHAKLSGGGAVVSQLAFHTQIVCAFALRVFTVWIW